MNKAIKFLWMAIASASILSNPMVSYPGRDSGIFLYIGSLILKGKIPYRDAWENKGPLVFYINALGLWLAGGSRWGIWLLEFLFIFISGYIAYRILKGLMGEIPALAGTFIFILTAGNVLQGGNFSEEYSLLFSFMAIYFFISSLQDSRGRSNDVFIIGVTLGLNILLRPNNISVQVAICAAYFALTFFSQDWKLLFKRAGQILAGMLAILIPVILYFYANNALTEMINVVIVFNSQYSEGGGVSRIIEGAVNAANGMGLLWIGIAIIGYLFALVSIFKNETRKTLLGSLLLVLLIGFPIEAVLSTVSGKNYEHYFIGWSVYVGLLFGYSVYMVLTKLKQDTAKHTARLAWLLLFAAIFLHAESWKNYANTLAQFAAYHPQFEYRDALIDYIQYNTAPEEKVLVWGFRPIINFVSGRESPVTYLPYPLSHVDTPLAHRWADEFYTQITANPPALIINMIEEADRERIPDLDPEVRKGQKIKWKEVVLAHNYKETLDFISQNYVRVDVIQGYDIYRLKTGASNTLSLLRHFCIQIGYDIYK